MPIQLYFTVSTFAFTILSSNVQFYYVDLKKGKAGNARENQAGIELITVKWGEIMIAGVKIAAMIAIVTETETALGTMIQEVTGDHVHGQKKGQGIMIATGSYFFHLAYCIVYIMLTLAIPNQLYTQRNVVSI